VAAGQTDRTWVNRGRTRRRPRLGRFSLQYFDRFEFSRGAESCQRMLSVAPQADGREKGSGTKSAKHPKGRSGFWYLSPFPGKRTTPTSWP